MEGLAKQALVGIGVEVHRFGKDDKNSVSVGIPYGVSVNRDLGKKKVRPTIGFGLTGPNIGLTVARKKKEVQEDQKTAGSNDMLGLAKVAAEYANREDDLINNIDHASAKKHSLEASVHPNIQSEQSKAKGVHALTGTGIGGLAGAALGGAIGGAPLALVGGVYGGVTGLAIGAITGSVKADSILLQRDPKLYHEIQNAKTEEFLAHAALERHHDLKNLYSQPQQHNVYHYQGK